MYKHIIYNINNLSVFICIGCVVILIRLLTHKVWPRVSVLIFMHIIVYIVYIIITIYTINNAFRGVVRA